MKHSVVNEQLAMFDLQPPTQVAKENLTRGALLPAQWSQFIDLNRVCTIFGITIPSAIIWIEKNILPGVRLGSNRKWLVPYDSVVDFCNDLRMRYYIRDRRPKLGAGMRRWRDEDLLPFPLSDTIDSKQAALGLDVDVRALNLLITDRAPGELGAFDAYRCVEQSPWRISYSSLLKYAAELGRNLK